jgi:uncharacterized protein YqeY
MESPLAQKLNDDLKQSMRDKNELKTSTLRMLISNLKYAEMRKRSELFEAEVKKLPPPLNKDDEVYQARLKAVGDAVAAREIAFTDQDVLGVIAKEIKQRDDSISSYQAGKRPDLANKEAAEKTILESYMPAQLGSDEIRAVASKLIAEVGAKGLSDKGKVMGKLVAQLKGRADGKAINDIVTQLLSSM